MGNRETHGMNEIVKEMERVWREVRASSDRPDVYMTHNQDFAREYQQWVLNRQLLAHEFVACWLAVCSLYGRRTFTDYRVQAARRRYIAAREVPQRLAA